MRTLIANYAEPRAAFATLLELECDTRILFFSGKSGSGKTTLLNACLADARAAEKCFPVLSLNFRGSDNTLPGIFAYFGRHLGWEHFPTLVQQVTALQNLPPVQIDHNWLAGINSQINLTLKFAPADRAERRSALTEAFFNDLRTYPTFLLIAFDTFENATPEVQEWIAGPFLARIADIPALRVLIAGQTVPDPHNIEWSHICTHHILYGVPEAIHWLPVVETMGRYIAAPDPLCWLAGICYTLKGAPNQIMQVIESLPRKEVAA